MTYLLLANIYIRPLSSVQSKLRFILYEPHDLEWAELVKHVLLRFVGLLF